MRPFLKWAGGKGQILGELMARVAGLEFAAYHEPFVGGGALFFELARTGRLARANSFLSDANPSLISAYQGVQTDVECVIKRLKEHRAHHSSEYYYKVRAMAPEDLCERAARIIYLNKTCYNGLYRENSKGQFNVPVGRYANPAICDEKNLRAVAQALKPARIACRRFESVLDYAQPGDLVYFDPPYHPVSKTSSFTKYDKNDFGETDQRRLAEVYAELSRRGVWVLLSNSMTDFIRELYTNFTIEEVLASRCVNSKADRRGKIPEALIRNFNTESSRLSQREFDLRHF